MKPAALSAATSSMSVRRMVAASPSVTVWSSSLAVGATLVTDTVVVAVVLCTPSDTRSRTVCVAGPSAGV